MKTNKWSNNYRGYAGTYKVGILSSFNLELQLKDAESGLKN